MVFLASSFSETLESIFAFLCFWCLVWYVIVRLKSKTWGKNSYYGISKKVYDAAFDLYKDEEFVKDFVNILKKESNLADIVAKSQSQYYADAQPYKGAKKRWLQEDAQDWEGLIKGNIRGQGFDVDAKRIASDVIKSNGYKKFSKKYEFTKDDDKDMFTVIYYIVTRPDFADTAEKYLYTASSNSRNVPVPPLSRHSFVYPTG